MSSTGRLGILVGGGPSPGINSVIAAVTIECQRAGVTAVGLRDGFRWLMQGNTDHVEMLTAERVAEEHFRGGSLLGTGRANPTRKPEHLAATLASLQHLGIDKLVTIGGDDTAFSAMRLAQASAEGGQRLCVVHVPKTIDNDLALPAHVDTFGFQTAVHLGAELAENLIRDAQTMSRWFLIVAMGRKAGHLALAIGAAIDAAITLIAEEWPPGPIPLGQVTDELVGAILKGRALGRAWGVAVVAEGIVDRLDPADMAAAGEVKLDEHGNVRLGELDIGRLFKSQVVASLAALGLEQTIVTKEIGYELRCADPLAIDKLYCRELGYCAARLALSDRGSAMVSVENGELKPIPFDALLDPNTGRTRVRFVDTRGLRYRIARTYMVRLTSQDLANPVTLQRLSELAGLSPTQFGQRFSHIGDREPPALQVELN